MSGNPTSSGVVRLDFLTLTFKNREAIPNNNLQKIVLNDNVQMLQNEQNGRRTYKQSGLEKQFAKNHPG